MRWEWWLFALVRGDVVDDAVESFFAARNLTNASLAASDSDTVVANVTLRNETVALLKSFGASVTERQEELREARKSLSEQINSIEGSYVELIGKVAEHMDKLEQRRANASTATA